MRNSAATTVSGFGITATSANDRRRSSSRGGWRASRANPHADQVAHLPREKILPGRARSPVDRWRWYHRPMHTGRSWLALIAAAAPDARDPETRYWHAANARGQGVEGEGPDRPSDYRPNPRSTLVVLGADGAGVCPFQGALSPLCARRPPDPRSDPHPGIFSRSPARPPRGDAAPAEDARLPDDPAGVVADVRVPRARAAGRSARRLRKADGDAAPTRCSRGCRTSFVSGVPGGVLVHPLPTTS
jgi:hypothetical protein